MKYDSISADFLLSNGDSADSVIIAILAQLKQADSNGKLTVIYDLKDIGLNIDTATLDDIGKTMPKESIVILDLSWSGAYAERLIPTLSNGGPGRFYSGVLLAFKHTDTRKAYFRFLSSGFEAACGFNGHDTKKLKGWRFDSDAILAIMPSPKDFNNIINNIYIHGTYFFTSDQMALFIDKPPTVRAGYITVSNSSHDKESDRKYTFIENHPDAKTWTRISYSTEWVSSPTVNLSAIPDERLRIGDMKINASGNVMMRINANTVKEI
ncbi:hypothetical protein [Morganella morganii]|uniref:hypothetical protein n=1 Tax=Morganella morganii TaxID=582 RepID=UPI0034D725DF